MLWPIKCNQRQPRLLAFRIDGGEVAGGTATTDGILEGAQHATITENSAGNYTITLNKAAARTLVVMGMATLTDATTLRIVAVDSDSVQVEQVGADQTTPEADGDFHITVLALDVADQT